MHDTPAKMILVAGPYRSGTADDPAKMTENIGVMERYALPLVRIAMDRGLSVYHALTEIPGCEESDF